MERPCVMLNSFRHPRVTAEQGGVHGSDRPAWILTQVQDDEGRAA